MGRRNDRNRALLPGEFQIFPESRDFYVVNISHARLHCANRPSRRHHISNRPAAVLFGKIDIRPLLTKASWPCGLPNLLGTIRDILADEANQLPDAIRSRRPWLFQLTGPLLSNACRPVRFRVTSTAEPEQERAGPADMARRKGAYTSRTLRAQCRKVVASHRRVRRARCHRLRWPGIS